jgi:hypothetical protein
MTPSRLRETAVAAGLASALLFVSAYSQESGMLFTFLPAMPLFLIGFCGGSRAMLMAAGCGFCAAIVLAQADGLGWYVAAVIFPSILFMQQALMWRPALASMRGNADENREWYPMGAVMTHIALYICLVFVLVAIYFIARDGGLQGMVLLATRIVKAFDPVDDEMRNALKELLASRGFLIFAPLAWLWALLLYAVATLANMILKEFYHTLRPSLALTPFALPDFILGLLAVSGILATLDSDSMEFIGKTLLMTLLLPYFLYGLSVIHQASHAWPGRMIFLFLLYFFLLAQHWPVLFIACYGVIQHCAGIGKRFSAGGRT